MPDIADMRSKRKREGGISQGQGLQSGSPFGPYFSAGGYEANRRTSPTAVKYFQHALWADRHRIGGAARSSSQRLGGASTPYSILSQGACADDHADAVGVGVGVAIPQGD